jgi:hypothetical protein
MKIKQFATITPRWGNIRITEHKYFEYQLEFDRYNTDPFRLSLEWTSRRDHAGIEFIFSIFKLFWFSMSIYDSRHWDFENNTWKEADC